MSRASISEWAPLHTHLKDFIPTVILLLPISYGVICKGRKNDFFACSLLLFSLYCGFRHSRFLVFSMVTLTIFGLPLASDFFTALSKRFPIRALRLDRMWSFAFALLSIIAAGLTVGSIFSDRIRRLDTSEYPVAAIQWLRESNQEGRLLIDFNNGAFALWRLYPHFQISMDSRYETAYPESTNLENSAALTFGSEENLAALRALNPTHILVPNSPYYREHEGDLRESWRPVYQDSQFMVLARTSVAIPVQKEVQPEVSTARSELWVPLF